MDFSGRIEGLSDPLSLGCPDAVAREHLVDPEAWKSRREALRAWHAYPPVATGWDANPSRWADPSPRRVYPDRDEAAEAWHSTLAGIKASFRERCMSGSLRGYGRTDPFQHDAWEWIRPDAWAYLKQEPKSGDYSFQGKLKYLSVHFQDTQGLPEDQAAWAYASADLLGALTRCEKDGGARTDARRKNTTATLVAYLDARAAAKAKWPQLRAQAAAELEEKIQAGILERVNGLIRPASRRSGCQAIGQEPEVAGMVSLGHLSENEVIIEIIKYQRCIRAEQKELKSEKFLCGIDELFWYATVRLGYKIAKTPFERNFIKLVRERAAKMAKEEHESQGTDPDEFEMTEARKQHQVLPWPR